MIAIVMMVCVDDILRLLSSVRPGTNTELRCRKPMPADGLDDGGPLLTRERVPELGFHSSKRDWKSGLASDKY